MQQDDDQPKQPKKLTRRAALARLGLGAAIAYTAPTVMHLDRSANATFRTTPCPGNWKGKGKGKKWCRKTKRPRGKRPRHGRRDHDDRRDRDRDRNRRRRPPSRTRRPTRRGRG